MAITAQSYFNALRSYLNMAHYEVQETDAGGILLREKVYFPDKREQVMRVRLSVPGEAIVINLDKKNSKGNCDPLFHFLDDNAKPWSKRCDFVIFHLNRGRIQVVILEFKSSGIPESVVDQIKSTEKWCRALHSIVKVYTEQTGRMYLTKYVLSCIPDPTKYLDGSGKYLLRDYSIRHYNYADIDGLALDALDNTNVQII